MSGNVDCVLFFFPNDRQGRSFVFKVNLSISSLNISDFLYQQLSNIDAWSIKIRDRNLCENRRGQSEVKKERVWRFHLSKESLAGPEMPPGRGRGRVKISTRTAMSPVHSHPPSHPI